MASFLDKYFKRQQTQGEADALAGKKEGLDAELSDIERDLRENPDSPSLVDKYKSTEQAAAATGDRLEGKKSELEGLITAEEKARYAALGIDKGGEVTHGDIATGYETLEQQTSGRITQLDQNVYPEETPAPASLDQMDEAAKKQAVEAAGPALDHIGQEPETPADSASPSANPIEKAKAAAQQARPVQAEEHAREQEGPEQDDD